MSVAIIKYNAGNIFSVESALKRLGVDAVVTADENMICNAEKVIFPGVGEASSTMKHLRENGFDKLITSLTQPLLGICLGMQLLCAKTEEGNADCLGVFDIDVKRFRPKLQEEKVPHMGWNNLYNVKSPLFDPSLESEYVYFVHSFYVPVVNEYTIASANFIQPFSAALNYKNFYATQFHPEKSGSVGAQILENFLKL